MFPKNKKINVIGTIYNNPKVLCVLFFSISFFLASGQNPGSKEKIADSIHTDDPDCKISNNYYYSINAKYPKNSLSILKEVNLFLVNQVDDIDNSGYVTFRFDIDCKGQITQNVQVLQTNEKYEKFSFGSAFVANLLQYLRTLDNWKIAKTKNGIPYSYHSFITFKIKNGKIVNVIP
jgi:hypothetical protein